MKQTISFSITTTGTTVSLFIFKRAKPLDGDRVALKRDAADGRWKGEHDLDQGTYGYTLDIRAGRPRSAWAMAMQRTGKKALQRKGALDSVGNGGRVGEISLA